MGVVTGPVFMSFVKGLAGVGRSLWTGRIFQLECQFEYLVVESPEVAVRRPKAPNNSLVWQQVLLEKGWVGGNLGEQVCNTGSLLHYLILSDQLNIFCHDIKEKNNHFVEVTATSSLAEFIPHGYWNSLLPCKFHLKVEILVVLEAHNPHHPIFQKLLTLFFLHHSSKTSL